MSVKIFNEPFTYWVENPSRKQHLLMFAMWPCVLSGANVVMTFVQAKDKAEEELKDLDFQNLLENQFLPSNMPGRGLL